MLATYAFALVAPLAARADDADALVRDARNFSHLRSFRLAIDLESPNSKSHSDMVFVAPDRMRIDAVVQGMRATRVVIGRLTWVKFGDGKWQKVDLPANIDPLANVRNADLLAKNIHNYIVTFVGTQPLDGKSMHVYDYAAQPKKGFSAKRSRIWIGVDDGFPHRIVQANGPLKATLTYSGFNSSLSITGPG